MSFDYGAEATFGALSRVATQAPSLQLRQQAIARLSAGANGGYMLTPDQRTRWSSFFRDRLLEATSETRFREVVEALIGLSDLEALPMIAQALHRIDLGAETQRDVICEVFAVTNQSPAIRRQFQEAARPWESLAATAAAVLADPATCQAQLLIRPLPPARSAEEGKGFGRPSPMPRPLR
jgi:hypothetical protein